MKIGIIGAGMIGGTLAHLLVPLGHEVAVSNSRGPASLQGMVAELGPQASTLHALCGALARARGIERLYAVGPLSLAAADAFGDGAQHYARVETLIDELQSQWRPGTTALVKGSRSARLERLGALLREEACLQHAA